MLPCEAVKVSRPPASIVIFLATADVAVIGQAIYTSSLSVGGPLSPHVHGQSHAPQQGQFAGATHLFVSITGAPVLYTPRPYVIATRSPSIKKSSSTETFDGPS